MFFIYSINIKNNIFIMKNVKSFSLFEKANIENESRLSKSIVDILNAQIKNELESSQIYMGMTCWLDDEGWIGASKYYFKSAQEELVHMNKIYKYLFDRNCLAKVPTCDVIKQSFLKNPLTPPKITAALGGGKLDVITEQIKQQKALKNKR